MRTSFVHATLFAGPNHEDTPPSHIATQLPSRMRVHTEPGDMLIHEFLIRHPIAFCGRQTPLPALPGQQIPFLAALVHL